MLQPFQTQAYRGLLVVESKRKVKKRVIVNGNTYNNLFQVHYQMRKEGNLPRNYQIHRGLNSLLEVVQAPKIHIRQGNHCTHDSL